MYCIVGKTFTGDYLEAIRGWKHVDGDIPLRMKDRVPEYQDMFEQFSKTGNYADRDEEWKENEGWKPYFSELVRLTLEGAKYSDKGKGVVLTHATFRALTRSFVCKQLIDAGAKDVTMVFLECDFDAHMQALWKRYERFAKVGNTTIEELFKRYGIEGIVDFDAFVEYQIQFGSSYQGPQESVDHKPFHVVDVTAKDVTVLDSIDKAVDIIQQEGEESSSRRSGGGDSTLLTYEEIVEKIKNVDVKRDKDRHHY